MTNALGHRLATSVGDELTLGAYRRGNRLPWLPGALIDAWVPCARGEVATGVPSPHVYFVQTIGDASRDSGSIHCPECRIELAARRATGVGGPSQPTSVTAVPRPAPPVSQAALPF